MQWISVSHRKPFSPRLVSHGAPMWLNARKTEATYCSHDGGNMPGHLFLSPPFSSHIQWDAAVCLPPLGRYSMGIKDTKGFITLSLCCRVTLLEVWVGGEVIRTDRRGRLCAGPLKQVPSPCCAPSCSTSEMRERQGGCPSYLCTSPQSLPFSPELPSGYQAQAPRSHLLL